MVEEGVFPFQVEVTLTEDDYIAANLALYSTKKKSHSLLSTALVCAALGAASGWFFADVEAHASPWSTFIAPAIAGLLSGVAFHLLFKPLMLRRLVRRSVLSLKKRGPIPFLGRQVVTFDERGITGQSALSTIQLTWASLTARSADAERLYLLSGGAAFVTLPRRDLSKDELARIEEIIDRYLS